MRSIVFEPWIAGLSPALVGGLCALVFVATSLVDKWYPSGRFIDHPEAIFRSVILAALAFVPMLLVDNWYLKSIIFLVISIVVWRMSRELLIQIIARLMTIAICWGFAWLASNGVALVGPRAADVIFYGIGLLWTVLARWLGSDTRGSPPVFPKQNFMTPAEPHR